MLCRLSAGCLDHIRYHPPTWFRLKLRARTNALLAISCLAATPVLATTYYVSPTGSDGNIGTNPASPWGSVNKVDSATFKPGDQILFQYGSTWNASLAATSSGTTNNPIVYGAYGNPTLGNPTFVGSDPISSSAFTPVAGTTYQTTYSTLPVTWVYDNNQLTHEALDALTQSGSTNASDPATQLNYVENNPDSFYYNAGNGQLFVNTGGSLAGQALRVGTRADALNSLGQSNLIFQNLNTTQTAQDGGGYGIRIENSINVKVLNSTVSLSGKHAVGVIDTIGFSGTNLVANGSAPDQGFGGASAFVSYGDGNTGIVQGSNNTSVWTNISYVNTNGAYPVYLTHAEYGGVASVTLNNVTSLNGYGTGILISAGDPNERVLINGAQLNDSELSLNTNNSVINGVTLLYGAASIVISGSHDVVQNCTFIGQFPNVMSYGQDGAVVDSGTNNTVRFNDFNLLPNNLEGPSIGITLPQSHTNIQGNILSPVGGATVGIWMIYPSNPALQSNYNLLNPGDSFALGGVPITIAQWQAYGNDLQSQIGAPNYTNASAGVYSLQPGSPGIGLFTGTIDPTLTTANSLLGAVNPDGSYNAGMNPSIWPQMNALPAALYLNNGQTNTVTPFGGTLAISSSGAIISGSTSTLNVIGNISNAGTIIIQGTWMQTGNVINTGTVSISGGQIWSPGSTFTNLSGVATFATDAGGSVAPEEYLAVNVSGGTVVFQSTQHLTSLSVLTGARAQLTSTPGNGRSILLTPSLAITGTLDLTNNDLIVESGNLTAVMGLVRATLLNNWNGPGIASSAAANDSTHATALGVIQNSVDGITPLYGSGSALGLFDGSNPGPADVLVKYTYFGDSNLDGKIDGSDYTRIDNGYLLNLTGWYNGDFNYDGVVNGSDYTLIDNAYNTQGLVIGTITSEIAPTSVPEPAALAWLMIAMPLLRRRKPFNRGA